MDARNDGRWTRLDMAFDKAKMLLDEWMSKYHDKNCYPPTIINITDGEYNGAAKEIVRQKANELKQMFTNDGNVILFNIHISTDKGMSVSFPLSKTELNGDDYACDLFNLSSLLPLRYNEEIAKMRNANNKERHSAMSVNADMTTLIKLMDIGTPTNINPGT